MVTLSITTSYYKLTNNYHKLSYREQNHLIFQLYILSLGLYLKHLTNDDRSIDALSKIIMEEYSLNFK